MTRKVHDRTTTPARESSRAWNAFVAYRSMPPGERSLERLCQQFKQQAKLHESNPEIPPPPTTDLDSLKLWSVRWAWQARIVVWEQEQEEVRRAELRRLAVEQARQDAKLLHDVGVGSLSVAAVLLNDMIDPSTGTPKRPASGRDVQPLVRAAIDCLATASGHEPEGGAASGLDKVLDVAPDDVKSALLRAIRSLAEWQESTAGRR